MKLHTLATTDCSQKRVLMRVDFNVALDSLDNETEIFRLTSVTESVRYILNQPGTTLTLITHFGRPEGAPTPEYSVEPLIPVLEKIFQEKVQFTPDCLQTDDFSQGRIALRENLRFYAEEEKNDKKFAERLAAQFDLYVNEAFSVCHRAHASVQAITHFLPSVAGFHLEKEVQELTRALTTPARPAVAILGGAKIETKLPLIHTFEKTYDFVLLGGMIANEAKDRGMVFEHNVVLPIDYRAEGRFDIGDETVAQFVAIIEQAKTIVWNGPLGKFEEPPFHTGTQKILEALITSSAYVIAGGGESLTAIQKNNAFEKIDVISTGGGAMLAFLAGEVLPGLDALQQA